MLTGVSSVRKLRRSIHLVGLAFIFTLSSCATPPKLNNKKIQKAVLERQTVQTLSKIEVRGSKTIREKLNRFNRSLKRKNLSEADWQLHDDLLDYYIELKKGGSSKVVVPGKSRITLPLETYCLNSGKAAPELKEVYHWQKNTPGIKYYSDLLNLRRSFQITQRDLQELLWNLQNETKWEDYPDKFKAILQKVDPHASSKLPSQAQDQVKDLVTDSVLGLPGVNEALNTYNLIKGKYYEYNEFKRSVERLTSKASLGDHDDLPRIPDTELYSQSVSEGYNSQSVTFYNPSDRPQELDLEKYYLAPERPDVQRIGINPTVSDDPMLLSDLEKALYETMARLGIGFTPVVNDVADLFEFLTGRDFLTAKPLSIDERLVSGVGIVLGSGTAYRYVKRWVNAPNQYLPKFESELNKIATKFPDRNSLNAFQIPFYESQRGAHEIGKALDYRGTQELSRFLKDRQVLRQDRIKTIKSFESGSLTRRIALKDERVYRWHNGDETAQQFGRFVSPDKLTDSATAREKFALPTHNQMKYLDSFLLKKGNIIFEGRVAPNFGQPGGGRQILIPGDIQNALKLVERIK